MMVFGPKCVVGWGLWFVFFFFALFGTIQEGVILAGLSQSSVTEKASNFEGHTNNCWCFLGRVSYRMFVSADAATLGFCLHPWCAKENLCCKGPLWCCRRTLCARTKEYCIGMSHEREGAKGFLSGALHIYINSNIFPIDIPLWHEFCVGAETEIRSLFLFCVNS